MHINGDWSSAYNEDLRYDPREDQSFMNFIPDFMGSRQQTREAYNLAYKDLSFENDHPNKPGAREGAKPNAKPIFLVGTKKGEAPIVNYK